MKHRSIILVVILLTALVLSDCAGTKPITRRSELADPIETGPITLLTTDGAKFVFNNYRVGDSVITGAGVRVDSSAETLFRGDIALSQIASIHAPDTKIMKFLVAATGIVAFGVIAADQSRKNDFSVRDVVSYRGPSTDIISCPFLYTYDGDSCIFASETYAGAIIKPAERAVYDRLPACRETGGTYRLRLTNERPETHYNNLLALRTVDAPPDVDVIADQAGRVHTIAGRVRPSAVRDLSGRDIVRLVSSDDTLLWRSDCAHSAFTRDEEFTDGLVCEFPKPAGASAMKLLVTGRNTSLGVFAFTRLFELTGSKTLEWYHKVEGDSVEAVKFLRFMKREGMLHIFIEQDDGRWSECGMLNDVGPLMEKEQLAVIDCRMITRPFVRLKLLSATDLWMINAVAADFSDDRPVDEQSCTLVSARADDGRDVGAELRSDDARYFTTVTGQSAELQFSVPAHRLQASHRRHLIATTKGYYHQWFGARSDSHEEIVEKILDDPSFGARLLMPEWQKVRTRTRDASARDADLDR